MTYAKTRCERYSFGMRPPFLGVHAAEPQRYPALLESSAPHPSVGRFDILLAGAGETFVGKRVSEDARVALADRTTAARQGAPALYRRLVPLFGI